MELPSRPGQALQLPKELLGDVYADPYAKKKAHDHGDLPQAGKSLSKAEVAALKEEVWGPRSDRFCHGLKFTFRKFGSIFINSFVHKTYPTITRILRPRPRSLVR